MSEQKPKQRWSQYDKYGRNVPGCTLDMRSSIALELIRSNSALVTGQPDGEDSAGRARMRQEPPRDLVARVFEIVDAFMEEVETTGGIRDDAPEAQKGA